MTDFQGLINKSIKELRTRSRLTQEKFSEKCGLSSPDNYRNIEYNRHMPRPETINKICDAFNITPIELMTITINSTPQEKIDNIITRISNLNATQLNLLEGFLDVILSNKE